MAARTDSHTRRCRSTFASRSVRTQMIVLWSAATAGAARRGRCPRRPRARSRGRTARRRARSRARAASRCARRTPRPGSRPAGSGRCRRRRCRSARSRASGPAARRPAARRGRGRARRRRSAARPARGSPRPRRRRSRPSRRSRSRPRLESTRNGVSRTGKNVSTSRIGIEEATTSVASGGSSVPELGGHARLVEPRRPDASSAIAPRRGPVGVVPARRATRCPCACAAAASSAPRASSRGSAPTIVADDAGRVLPRGLGVERDLSASSPASHVRSGLEVGRSPTRSTSSGACAAAHSGARSSAS